MKEKLAIFIFLMLRIILVFSFQFIGYLFVIEQPDSWQKSASLWMVYLTLTNLLLLIVMVIAFKKAKQSYTAFFEMKDRSSLILFLKWLPALVIMAVGPNLFLSLLFYSDIQAGAELLLLDPPVWAMVVALSLFPVLQGLVELPFYFMFVMPILKQVSKKRWIYLGIPILFLSIQHAFMPFFSDVTYIIYRSLMFLPFALLIGLLLEMKPKLLPYLSILHILMNLSFMLMMFI